MSDELRYFQGLDYRPPHCLEVAESSGYEGGHCAECHGDNFSGHECLIEVKLAGGDSAEVCGPMLAWLRSNGHLDPAEDARAICEETFNLFIEEGS